MDSGNVCDDLLEPSPVLGPEEESGRSRQGAQAGEGSESTGWAGLEAPDAGERPSP